MSDIECDYDDWRELSESASNSMEPALRCFQVETNGTRKVWDALSETEKWRFMRPPRVSEPRLASGTFFLRSSVEGSVVPITTQEAYRNWQHSFQAQ